MKLERNRPYGYAHIKQMERDEDVAALIAALDVPKVNESANLRSAVVTALSRIDSRQAIPTLVDLLQSDSAESVRRASARALGRLGDPSALAPLRVALKDESKTVRLWTIQSLGLLRDRDSVDDLIEMLDSPDWSVRSYAACALGEIGDQRATEPLIRHIQDEKGTVLTAVLSALRKMSDSRAVGPLREAREAAGWLRRRRLDAALSDLEARFGR